MAYVVKLTSPEGEEYYGTEADHEGLRYRSHSLEGAQYFDSLDKASASVSEFRAVKEISSYKYEVVVV